MSSVSKSEIELRFPSSIYYADPYAAIRSILGNDVEIISFKESNIILPDSSILVNVEYSAIDFDLFKLYEIEETKIASQQSQKVVATKLKDSITGEYLPDDKIVVISNYSPKYKWIFIKYLDRVNIIGKNTIIKYYGFAPQVKSEVLHSYCSIIDNEFLSYHGNLLNINKEVQSLHSSGNKLNVQNEIKAIQKLGNNGIETNNFTNTNFDISVIYNLVQNESTISKTDANSQIEKEIKLNDVDKESGIINLSGISESEIKKAFINQRGIILMSKFRDNINAIVWFNTSQCPTNNVCITENVINNLLIVMKYDNYNMKLWSSN